jgi:protein gp37
MAETTGISWCDATWSPWFGCTQVSMGEKGACEGCYARAMHELRFGRVVFGGPGRGEGTRDVRAEAAWKIPLRWNDDPSILIGEARAAAGERPTVFPSMCDPFDNHPALVQPRHRFFRLIQATPNITWLPLTKRPGNIVKMWLEFVRAERVAANVKGEEPSDGQLLAEYPFPRNVMLGCTVVTQPEADRDLPALLQAAWLLKVAITFVSMEPLLGPVDLARISTLRFRGAETLNALTGELFGMFGDFAGYLPTKLGWVIAGGETDQGKHKARPSNPEWFRDLRDQCAAAGVPFHFKQWGEWGPREAMGVDRFRIEHSTVFTADETDGEDQFVHRFGKKSLTRELDGVTHDARPEVRA